MKYSTALGDKICKAIAKSSVGLRHICMQLNVPYSTVTDWIYDPSHELHSKYLQAKQMQLHCLAEEICTMVDDLTNDDMEAEQNGKKKTALHREHISRTRLRMQARIAIITKLAPVLYGTKPQKIRHKVIMPPPPGQETTPEPSVRPEKPVAQKQENKKTARISRTRQDSAKPAKNKKITTSSTQAFADTESLPKPAAKEIVKSSPKNTIKYLPDGTFEEYNEHRNLIRKSCKPYNPKPHHQGFW